MDFPLPDLAALAQRTREQIFARWTQDPAHFRQSCRVAAGRLLEGVEEMRIVGGLLDQSGGGGLVARRQGELLEEVAAYLEAFAAATPDTSPTPPN